MPAPTNPRKRPLMPSGLLRKTLRAAGHHLFAIVQVGKEGITDAVVHQLDQALAEHELVKVKVGAGSPEDRFAVAEGLAEGAGAAVAQILGRTMLLYRKGLERSRFEPGPADLAPAPRAKPGRPKPGRPKPGRPKPGRPKPGRPKPRAGHGRRAR